MVEKLGHKIYINANIEIPPRAIYHARDSCYTYIGDITFVVRALLSVKVVLRLKWMRKQASLA